MFSWQNIFIATLCFLTFLMILEKARADTKYPSDSITQHFEFLSNETDVTILNASNRTILHLQYLTDPARTIPLTLYCGSASESSEIFETHNVEPEIQLDLNYFCNKTINWTISNVGGTKLGHIILTWVPRNTASTSDPEISYNQSQTNLFYGFIVFFVSMLIPMWFFKRRT